MKKKALYTHQKEIIVEDPKKCGIFTGTGTGKTRIALSLAEGHTMVICPKTQKEDENWPREKAKMAKEGIKTRITELTVVSKEYFRDHWTELPIADTLIGDEAHTILGVTPNTVQRNRVQYPKASQTFEALQEYVKYAKPKRIYLCTATIMRSPMTVFAAAVILGHLKGTIEEFYRFRATFYIQLPMGYRPVFVVSNDTRVKDKLARLVKKLGYVGRLEDFFDVPEQTFKTESVILTPKQRAAIDEVSVNFPDPLTALTKRHQIENGILNGDEFTATEFFDNAKLDRICELAIEFPKMVIFAKYRAQIAKLEAELKHDNYNVLTLTGDTKDRGALIKKANSLKSCIFIAQAQISAGWELPAFPVMVFASRTYSYVDYTQGIGRILRANALKKNLYINLVVKGGIDAAVDKALTNKQSFDERIYLGI